MKSSPFSLYVHIPYCVQKCPYCDFNTYAVAHVPEEDYIASALSEIDFYAADPHWNSRRIETIYFGGGTPSLIKPHQYKKLFSLLRERFELQDGLEITLEANPGMLDRESLDGFLEAGINRISLGAQSFQIKMLEKLGRVHTAAQIKESVEQARISGFNNISIDLIFGVPEQDIDLLDSDIEEALLLRPEHISLYSLTYEKGTPFYLAKKKGTLKPVSNDNVSTMMEHLIQKLTAHGYEHYEISNFSIPGKNSQHNSAYWNRVDYLGIGAGAHSFLKLSNQKAQRWSNYALPAEYMNHTTGHGKAVSWKESLEKKDLIFEYFFLGLRKIEGVDLSTFQEEFHEELSDPYLNVIESLIDEKLLEKSGDSIRFSKKGLLVGDSVIEQFALHL